MIVDVDLRENFGPARDQGPRPTCMAFAASDAHAGVRSGWNPLCVEWAYFHALRRDGGLPHDGVKMDSMLDTLRFDGQPPETTWPYRAALFTDTSTWNPPTCNTIFRRESVMESPIVVAIIRCLSVRKPVLLTMSISNSFYLPDSEGVIASMESVDPHRVHAVVAVGYGHRNNKLFILVRNSWGKDWGIQGYSWISESYIASRILSAATMGQEI